MRQMARTIALAALLGMVLSGCAVFGSGERASERPAQRFPELSDMPADVSVTSAEERSRAVLSLRVTALRASLARTVVVPETGTPVPWPPLTARDPFIPEALRRARGAIPSQQRLLPPPPDPSQLPPVAPAGGRG